MKNKGLFIARTQTAVPDAAQPLAATPLGYTTMELTAKEITMEKRISQNQDLEIARLLPIQTADLDQEALPTVNARDLHAFLEVGKDFSNWIKDRIAKFEFVENQDFVCSPILASKDQPVGRGGYNRLDYHLTLDMAKELAMVENNHKGREARRYFIACEKALRERPRKPSCGIPDIDPQEVERVSRMARLVESYARNFRAMGMGLPDRQEALLNAMWDHHGMDLRAFLPKERAAERGRETDRSGLRDPEAFLRALICAPLRRGPETTLVGHALYESAMCEDLASKHALALVGLAAKWRNGLPYLVVAVRSPELAEVLSGTLWHRNGSWREPLRALPGVEKRAAAFPDRIVKAYFVSWEAIPLRSLTG
ncbi:antA/AntB antirepressor family protein [Acidithiobacillus sp.]